MLDYAGMVNTRSGLVTNLRFGDITGTVAKNMAATDYRARILADGPTAYLRLGESGVTTAAFDECHSFPGTYVGTPPRVAGLVVGDADKAVSLNGSSQYVDLGTAGGALGLGRLPFTIACRVGGHTPDASYRTIAGSYTAGTPGGVSLLSQSGNLIFARSAATDDSVIAPPLSASATHEVVATYDGTTMTLYVDGRVWGTPLASSLNIPAGISLRIGSSPTTYSGFAGKIDEFALYDRALSATEVISRFRAGTMNGLYVASPTLGVTGPVDKAVTLNGTSQYIGVGAVDWFDGTNPWTILLSIKQGAAATWQAPLGAMLTDGGGAQGLVMVSNDTLWGIGRYLNGVQVANGCHSAPVNDNAWHMLAATYDGSTITLYKDGVVGLPPGGGYNGPTVADAASMKPNLAPLLVGSSTLYTLLTGSLAELAVFNRALPASLIGGLYDAWDAS
jgi:hypothetical protein